MIKIRAPVAAGTFYDLNPAKLKKLVESCFRHPFGPKIMERKSVISGIVPHAGFIYSGAVAAWVYSKIEKGNYILLGPNHYGTGSKFAIMVEGLWKTPLGEVGVDRGMAERILSCKLIEHDVIPHEHEHSIEVQLPFLQYRFGDDFKFVPISIRNEFPDKDFLEECRLIGREVAKAIKAEKRKWTLIATSDLSHYLPHEIAKDVDEYIISSVLKLDEQEFFQRLGERNASVCGFGPIAIAIAAAKELGARKSELLKYTTSGDIMKEYGSVVGYASIIIY